MKGVTVIGEREVCDKSPAGRAEYNRRVVEMAERQGWLCAICGEYMHGGNVSFEHQDGRGMGGSLRDDRIEKNGKIYNAATHAICNAKKGSRRYEWRNGYFEPVVGKYAN